MTSLLTQGELITTESLVDALVACWMSDYKLGAAVTQAAGLTFKVKVEVADWNAMFQRASEVFPLLSSLSSGKQPVKAWIATHCPKASDALWDSKPNLAKKYLLRHANGKMRTGMGRGGLKKADVKEAKAATEGLLTIYVRERDKTHDWKTVK